MDNWHNIIKWKFNLAWVFLKLANRANKCAFDYQNVGLYLD